MSTILISQRRWFHACALLLAISSASGCTDPIDPTDRDPGPTITSCAESGGTVQRSSGTTTWARRGSPHRIEADVTVTGSLAVEPGVLVCVSPGVTLTVTDSMLAVGTRTDSIRFLPADPAAGWQQLQLGACCGGTQESMLRHVRFEGASILVGNAVQIDSSVIRGSIAANTSVLRDVLIESGGVSVISYGSGSLENVVVRGGGVGAGRRTRLHLSAVRIEGSPGTGLSLFPFTGGGTRLTIDRPIRITGGAGYPVSGTLDMLDALFREPGSVDSLTGNARDTILITAIGFHSLPMTITPALAWRISAGECVCGAIGPLHMQAGSSLVLNFNHIDALSVRGLTADGNADDRISITGNTPFPLPVTGAGLRLEGGAGESATLRGVRLDNLRVFASEGLAVTLDDVIATRSYIDLSATTATLRSVRLHEAFYDALIVGPGAVIENASILSSSGHGVVVRGAGVHMSACTIGGNGGHGVLVESGDVRIHGCSLLPNGLDAVAATGTGSADARDNWWGSASGPGAAGAATVSGAVTWDPFLMAPPELESSAATIEITGQAAVATSDTVRLSAVVRDAAGNILPFEPVHWSAADPSVAEVFANGLVFGASAGETIVTAAVNGSTTVRASAPVQVTPGAPVFDWERWDLDSYAGAPWAIDGHLFLGGIGGRVRHLHAGSWSTMQIAPEEENFDAIWGRSADDLYAVTSIPATSQGRLFHYDGTAWTAVHVFDGSPTALWGTASGDLFVATRMGLWHFDGTSWHQIHAGDVPTVWARAPDDVYYRIYSAGSSHVFHYDGSTARDLGAPGHVQLWGTDDAVFAAGPALFRYDPPGDWRDLSASESAELYRVTGNGSTDVYAAGRGGSLRHYDGSLVRPIWARGAPSYEWIPLIAVDGPHVYMVLNRTVMRGTRRN